MSGGITILLIAAIGVGYFLYQKYRSQNRGGIMTEVRSRLTSVLRGNLQRRNQNHNERRQQIATPSNTPPVEPVQIHQEVGRVNNRPLVPASRDSITETGPMIYFANDRHGRSDKEYRFNYKKVGGGWRAYILRTPNLGTRNSSSGIIHRLHDDAGYYICWDRQVNSLKDMQTISRRWADSIQEYLSTGRFG